VYSRCWAPENIGSQTRFEDAPAVNHANIVADLGDHAEVVRDEQDRGPELGLQLFDEPQDAAGP
jgi:hypothetical protein